MKPPEWEGIVSILSPILMIIVTRTGPRVEDIKYLFRHMWYSGNQILISFLGQVEDFEDAVSRLSAIEKDLCGMDTRLSREAPIQWLRRVKVLQNMAEEIKVRKKKNCARNYFNKFYLAKKAGKEIKTARNLIVRGEYLLWWAQARPQHPIRHDRPQQPRDQPWGMDSYKKNVLDFIENKQGTESQLLGIWGMRGVGKTSLLRLVYDSYPDKAFVGHIMFVGAGRQSTVSTVQHAIAIKFGLDWPMMSTLDDLSRAMYIFSSLENKRFLLLLDDVEEPLRLEDIGLPIVSGRQQKIILATRNPEICSLMGCDGNNTIEMRCLGEVDAWNLFKDEVQNEIIDVHPQVHQLAKQMVAECHGLPIAICAIARTMSTKRDVNNWSNAHDLLKDKHSPTQINEGYSCLDILRNELKNSFLVTSVWPEDGRIPRSAIKEDGIATIKEDGITQWSEKDVAIPWLKEEESVPWSGKNDGSITSAKKDEDESASVCKKEDDTVPWLQEDGSLGWLQTKGGSLLWFEQKEDGSIPWLPEGEDENMAGSQKEDGNIPLAKKEEDGHITHKRALFSREPWVKNGDGDSTWATKEEDGHTRKESSSLHKKEKLAPNFKKEKLKQL